MERLDIISQRAGRLLKQTTGYLAFIPTPLPPDPALSFDATMLNLLSKADLALGQLNGLASIIPEPDLFVYLYVRKEALLSSQIEGTQCSLEDVLAEDVDQARRDDIEEVANYVAAMNRGLDRLDDLPVSARLLTELHGVLMKGVRGANRAPGEIRKTQNWIGSPGATLTTAQFVPPPPHLVVECMSDLEKYVNKDDDTPPLIRAALAHAQFETIHPFLDGNGRLGRLLITVLLCSWRVMRKPLLYLSYYFKANRSEYYAKLTDVRAKGAWEDWVKFFLRGVAESAEMANRTALEIHHLHQADLAKLQKLKAAANVLRVFNVLCRFPIASISDLAKHMPTLGTPTLQRAVDKLVGLKILREATGARRNRRWIYDAYLTVLTRDTITPTG